MNELDGRMVDPVVHQTADGITTIEWPEGTTDADWVKVSVPLLRQMNDELNRLRSDGATTMIRLYSASVAGRAAGPPPWRSKNDGKYFERYARAYLAAQRGAIREMNWSENPA